MSGCVEDNASVKMSEGGEVSPITGGEEPMGGERPGGDPDSTGGVSAGGEQVIDYSVIKVNEVVTVGDPSDWVELYNMGEVDVDLTGCFLSDDLETLDKGVISSGSSAIVPAQGFALLLINDDTFGFKLGRDEAIALSAPDGTLIDALDYEEGDAPLNGSYGRLPDGEGEAQTLYQQTPAGPNQAGDAPVCGDDICDPEEECLEDCSICGDDLCDMGEVCPDDCSVCGDGTCDPDEPCELDCVESMCGDGVCSAGETCEEDCSSELELVINEIVAAGAPDWVELYNLSEDEIDLGDLYLSDAPDEPLKASLNGLEIEGMSFLLIEVSRQTLGFKLGGDEALYLKTSAGALVDQVDWAEGDAPEGMSYGRSPDGDGEFRTLTTPSPQASNSVD
jgi:hypothetical protein